MHTEVWYDSNMSPLSEVIQETLSEQMPFSDEEWAQTPQAVQGFVLSLIVRVQALEAEVATLREQLNRNSRNSSKPPSSDGPEVFPKPRRRAKSGRKRGAQSGHKGTTRKLVPIEQVKESHDVKADVCCRCGHALVGEDPGPYRHQVTEIPPVVAEVSEYRLHTLTCSECGAQTRAKLPPGVPQGAFGPRLQAMVSLLSGRYHLSKRDTVDVMADFFQADVSLGSVPALEQRTSEAIRVPVDEAREYVKTQPVVHMDETGWREANQKAWLWVAATTLVTVFLIRRSRGGKVAREMLDEAFKGIVVSDRWSAYNWLLTILRQLCWAHLLRDFQAFVDRGGESQPIGEAILAQADLMFQWWHKIRDGTMSRATFQEKMQPVQRKVGELLRQGTACNHSKTAGTCRDILKREEALWTFVRVEGVEPTNNLGERQVRPGVLWRKNSFGTQSEAGSRFAERIMTVIATLKQQHRNALDYLTEACDAANWGKQAPSLLPEDAVIAG
jgi:transposase